jgi:hypothetical protein
MDLPNNVTTLITGLAWPVTLLLVLLLFRKRIDALINTLGSRITRFQGFHFKIELGALAQAKALSTTVESLKKIYIPESGMGTIAAGVIQSASTDYIVIDVGGEGDMNWLTSRLFLLAAILERSRAVRCLVFLGEQQRFIGAVAPRDIRRAIGARFLPYETAFAQAYEVDPGNWTGS